MSSRIAIGSIRPAMVSPLGATAATRPATASLMSLIEGFDVTAAVLLCAHPWPLAGHGFGHRDGTVTTGAATLWPVSASEKRIIRNVKVRLLAMSVSSIQYQ
jgi:hypothetical protein